MATPRKRREQKARSIEQPPAPCSIRGFECAPGFGNYPRTGSLLKQCLEIKFHNGWRVPSKEPVEWDFRDIKSVEEARMAASWEYAREAEWIYDERAKNFARFTLENRDPSLGFRDEKDFRPWLENLTTCNPFLLAMSLCENSPAYHVAITIAGLWPVPWAGKPRKGCPRNAFFPLHLPIIRSLDPSDPAPPPPFGGPIRHHKIEINWAASKKDIEAAFKLWVRTERPDDEIPTHDKRGKSEKDVFTTLKRLAAYRLQKAGLKYPEAQLQIKKYRADNPRGPHPDVFPKYESEGSWSTAIKCATELLTERFSEISIL